MNCTVKHMHMVRHCVTPTMTDWDTLPVHAQCATRSRVCTHYSLLATSWRSSLDTVLAAYRRMCYSFGQNPVSRHVHLLKRVVHVVIPNCHSNMVNNNQQAGDHVTEFESQIFIQLLSVQYSSKILQKAPELISRV